MKKHFTFIALLFFLLAPLFAEDIYSAYKKDFASFEQAVQQEYQNFEPLQTQHQNYFQTIKQLKAECEKVQKSQGSKIEASFRTAKMDFLIAEYLYQKTQIQSQNQSSLVFGFVGIAFFAIATIFFFIIYFVFVNERAKQRAVMAAIISEVEKERSRISRELHDSVAQNLRASTISQSATQRTELEMKAINDIRSICFNLNPPGLEEQRLDISIKELCLNFKKQSGIETNFFIDERIDFSNKKFSAENKINIYRIIQESLNNVQKHSESDSVAVTIQVINTPPHYKHSSNQQIAIEISDDGVGFSANSADINSIPNAKHANHFGINSMRQRAKLLGGQLFITSQKDCGTVVRLEFSTAENKSDR